ncbi:PilZ domain-containing protein [Xanthomonas campestris pv. badrii]|uniref:PilZ domain-containing protein n=1 Tax=Xanthomonas campestris pv. badrii TaxID=149696 RepID=A0A7Z2V9S2_XANCA|nr:PilZ domain-containing protein [Xanthomonas campestris]QJD67690.1 PilZ domain-containing protein [Xanthomonas campestris pv. badrii]
MSALGTLAPDAEAELFADTLSCQLRLPAGFHAGGDAGAHSAAETLLRSLGQVEDLRSEEASEDRGELPLLVQRMDAKLDLMLALIGRLVRQGDSGLIQNLVHWSVRGIRLNCATSHAAGTTGVVCLQPSDWLPELVQLPAQVLASASDGHDQWLWLRFAPLAPGLQDALERHLFRLHRRQIAEARRQR